MIKEKKKKKLQHLSAPKLLIHWADNFHSDRPQSHQRGQHHLLITNTGASQGRVLSPSLFTRNTNGCSSPSPSQKYSDGTEVVALLKNNTSRIDYQSFNTAGEVSGRDSRQDSNAEIYEIADFIGLTQRQHANK